MPSDFTSAVTLVRQAGLPPTREHIAVASLISDGRQRVAPDDLLMEAIDADLGLSREALAAALGRFAAAGVVDVEEGPVPPGAALGDPGQGAAALKAIANAWRLQILCRLGHGEMCVGDLGASLGLAQSALSQHLARLRKAGLIECRRLRQRVYYRLAVPALPAIVEGLCAACGKAGCREPARPDPSRP